MAIIHPFNLLSRLALFSFVLAVPLVAAIVPANAQPLSLEERGLKLRMLWHTNATPRVTRGFPSGDTVSVAPLVASDDTIRFANENGGEATVQVGGTFNAGLNAFDGVPGASGHTFFSSITVFSDIVGAVMRNQDSSNALQPWVAAGQTVDDGGGEEPLFFWVFDVGAFNAPSDPINLGRPFQVFSATIRIFNSAGSQVGSFSLGAGDTSTSTQLGGQASIFLEEIETGNMLPIDGEDVAAIAIEWELGIFKDGFESGDTLAWSTP